ncbi:MAG: PKD domain-containing protein [Actinomycetota bacterium]
MSARSDEQVAGRAHFEFAGDNRGQIAVGDHNNVQTTIVHNEAGSLVLSPGDDGKYYTERPLPLAPTSLPFERLVGRERFVEGVTGALAAREPVQVVAKDGWGKSVFLRWLVHTGQVEARPDGIITLSVKDLPLTDIQQLLFESRYEWIVEDERLKASSEGIAQSLATLDALIVVDDVGPGVDVDALRRSAAASQWVLAGQKRLISGEGHMVRLKGLDLDASLEVLGRAMGEELEDADRQLAERLVELVEGRPGELVLVGEAVADEETTLEEAVADRDPGPPRLVAVDRLDPVERDALALLRTSAPMTGEQLGVALGIDDGPELFDRLVAKGLFTAAASPPRLDPDVVDDLGGRLDEIPVRRTALANLTAWAGAPDTDRDEVAAAGPIAVALMRDAAAREDDRLCFGAARAFDAHLPLAARFGLWEQVIELGRGAAASLGPAEQAWATNQAGVLDWAAGRRWRAHLKFRRSQRIARRGRVEDVARVARHNRGTIRPFWWQQAAVVGAPVLVALVAAVLLWPGGSSDDPAAARRPVTITYTSEDGPPFRFSATCGDVGLFDAPLRWNDPIVLDAVSSSEPCAFGTDGLEDGVAFGRQASVSSDDWTVLMSVNGQVAASATSIEPGREPIEILLTAIESRGPPLARLTVRVALPNDADVDGVRVTIDCRPRLGGTIDPPFITPDQEWVSVDRKAGDTCDVVPPEQLDGDLDLVDIQTDSEASEVTERSASVTLASDVVVTVFYVAPPPPPTAPLRPVAVIEASPRDGPAPLVVDFDGSASTGEVAEHRWDFGDGATAEGAAVTHSYAEPGTYTATLVVADGAGQPSQPASVTIVVTQPEEPRPEPVAAISASPTRGVAPLVVSFDGSASSGDVAEYRWDFGDGGASATGVTASYRYERPGTYEATLVVVDADGRRSAPTSVSVLVTDVDNEAPTARLTARADPDDRLRYSFDGSGSTDADGDIAGYRWDFGDGERRETTGPVVDHVYVERGTYSVELVVVDDDGAASPPERIAIQIADRNDPIARATARAGADPSTFTFDGSDSEGDLISYEWDFGDGGVATGVTTTHTYAEPGVYDVQLTVGNTAGDTHTATLQVEIEPRAVPCRPRLAHEAIGLEAVGGGSIPLDDLTAPGRTVSEAWLTWVQRDGSVVDVEGVDGETTSPPIGVARHRSTTWRAYELDVTRVVRARPGSSLDITVVEGEVFGAVLVAATSVEGCTTPTETLRDVTGPGGDLLDWVYFRTTGAERSRPAVVDLAASAGRDRTVELAVSVAGIDSDDEQGQPPYGCRDHRLVVEIEGDGAVELLDVFGPNVAGCERPQPPTPRVVVADGTRYVAPEWATVELLVDVPADATEIRLTFVSDAVDRRASGPDSRLGASGLMVRQVVAVVLDD